MTDSRAGKSESQHRRALHSPKPHRRRVDLADADADGRACPLTVTVTDLAVPSRCSIASCPATGGGRCRGRGTAAVRSRASPPTADEGRCTSVAYDGAFLATMAWRSRVDGARASGGGAGAVVDADDGRGGDPGDDLRRGFAEPQGGACAARPDAGQQRRRLSSPPARRLRSSASDSLGEPARGTPTRSARSRWPSRRQTRRIHPEPRARGEGGLTSRIALFSVGGRWTRLFLQHYR